MCSSFNIHKCSNNVLVYLESSCYTFNYTILWQPAGQSRPSGGAWSAGPSGGTFASERVSDRPPRVSHISRNSRSRMSRRIASVIGASPASPSSCRHTSVEQTRESWVVHHNRFAPRQQKVGVAIRLGTPIIAFTVFVICLAGLGILPLYSLARSAKS
jgi:hypothetical protein